MNREEVDPELHILRSISRSLDGRERGELEGARFKLFAAFESQSKDGARRWAKAVRVSLLTLPDESLRAAGLEALERIEKAIEE